MEEIEEIQQEHDREQFYHDQEQEMQIKEKEMEHERNREHNMALMHQVRFSIQKTPLQDGVNRVCKIVCNWHLLFLKNPIKMIIFLKMSGRYSMFHLVCNI